ncbi:transketolase [Mammaliicoccus lentus]|uniref:transketolase n=1 Tax=Mammaliicoccus lentus TaxID=42858 RepID=UPI003CFAA794
MTKNIEQLSIDTIRTLSIDAVEHAQHGHPGMPMGAAPMGYVLWKKFMNHNPKNSDWFNRDRFVLSAGHGSMLLYSLLHLFDYGLTINDLKKFRQLHSKLPGHPEVGVAPGVEATTGPLGQGVAMSVGMAIAEAHLSEKYNKPGFPVVDHYTYAICGDGDLMEGISYESASLAGHLGLSKLILLYDSNDIISDGGIDGAFSENISERFKSCGWQVIYVEDGNDTQEIEQAITNAKSNKEQPTIIEVKTTIGYGAPTISGTSKAHSNPMGEDESKKAKEYYNWKFEKDFYVPDEVYKHFEEASIQGGENEKEWNKLLNQYKTEYPELYKELQQAISDKIPEDITLSLPKYEEGKELATRNAFGDSLNSVSEKLTWLVGGSADLASSTKTIIKNGESFSRENYKGRNIWFGIREFAMATISNGIALHKGLRVFNGTFLVFSDYMRPAIRLSALMNLPVIYVFTHDSIAVGQDGPTHQPIEQLSSLRSMPNLSVIRPGDANETVFAWKSALNNQKKPTALILGRQGIPTLKNTEKLAKVGVDKGAYLLSKVTNSPEGLLIATGSELSISIKAQELLLEEGIKVNVVSMPSWDKFEEQTESYKNTILPPDVKSRLAVEMGATQGWERFVGDKGEVFGINEFGMSGPGDEVIKFFDFTPENISNKMKKLLDK